MSNKRSSLSIAPPLANNTLRLLFGILVAVLLSVLMPNSALAAEVSALGISSSENSESDTSTAPMPDSFGRDTPRNTVQGFIAALSENDFLLASHYLNLSKTDNPVTNVRQLKRALDTGGRFQLDLQINNTPEGNLTDQLQPNQEKVGTIDINDKSVPIILERVVSKKGEQYWQFSVETLNSIPEVIENTAPTLVEHFKIDSFENKKLFGYDLIDVVATLVLTVAIFIHTYILVWLFYQFFRYSYPWVRKQPLPIPNRVILPLTVLIMSLILSEVLVYAGVSVTLREPANRFTEISAWLALTWLLLRLIDAVFSSAVNMSYRKNHVERVSVLGLLNKIVKALLLIFAIIVIFGNLGFDLTTGIAALGVGGLALALGAQKTIENLVGSVVVVADAPVRIGDYCKFGTYEGTVIDIGIRSSRVRTLTRTIVTVPNGDFSSMQIENFTSRDMFRFFHQLYLKRTANIDVIFQMVKDLDAFLESHYLTNQEWNQVNILELRQDCYVIQMQAYIIAKDVVEFYDKQNVVFVDLLNQVKNYDVEHALPTQQLILNQTDLDHIATVNDKDDPSKQPHNPQNIAESLEASLARKKSHQQRQDEEKAQKIKKVNLEKKHSSKSLARHTFRQVKQGITLAKYKKH